MLNGIVVLFEKVDVFQLTIDNKLSMLGLMGAASRNLYRDIEWKEGWCVFFVDLKGK